MTERTIDIVHVGSASRDLTDDDPRGWRLGGGVSYAALTTARLGLRTAAFMGVDALAAGASELDLLRAAGVELVFTPLETGPIFHNRETSGGRDQTSVAVGQPLPVVVPLADWRTAVAWSLVPVAAELDEAWATAVPEGSFVILGWQGMLRELVAGRQVKQRAARRSPLTDRADLVGVSCHDLAPGTTLSGLLRLLRPGARLLVTDGLSGGRLLRRTADGEIRTRRYVAIGAANDVDPTGAGDVFLAALVASAVEGMRESRGRAPRGPSWASLFDLRFAAAAASLVVEGPGLSGVPDRSAVIARLARDHASKPAAT